MHHTLKTISSILALTFLCSCTVQNGKIKSRIENVSRETDAFSINGERIILDGSSEGIQKFNEDADNEITEWTEDFETRASQITVPGSSPPCLQIRQTIKRNSGGIFSIITEKYVYLSGFHGNTWWSAKTYDSSADKILKLSDLFCDDTYPKILNERMNELIENDSEAYHDLWEQPQIDSTREDKFYLDDKNLVIFFEPYELSYYARGVVEFPIPLEKIRGYINEEYLP